jgi:hypothetical protein
VANKAAVFIVALLLVAGGVGFWLLDKAGPPAAPKMSLTPEAKAYTKNLQLSEVGMKATESYMGAAIVEIVGNITNSGDRALQQVDLNCVFYDRYGQIVLREPTAIVRAKDGGLKPGETKPFRLPFDSLPDSWNQGMPQLVIGQIVF